MVKDLKKEMTKITDKICESYQEDLLIDFLHLSSSYRLSQKHFIWFCRKCGTNLMIENNIRFKGTAEYDLFNYYSFDKSVVAYQLIIDSIRDNIIYGSIKKLNYNKELIKNKEKEIEPKKILVSVIYTDENNELGTKKISLNYNDKVFFDFFNVIGVDKKDIIHQIILYN